MKFFILVFIIRNFLHAYCQDFDFLTVIDCQYEAFNKSNCKCSMENNFLLISCNDHLDDDDNKLPNITAKYVKMYFGLTEWPYIPSYFNDTIYLDFSFNSIKSIEDFTNCPNLRMLNVSNNILTEIPKNLAQIRNLLILDLAYNLIEVVYMEYFISKYNSSTKNLRNEYFLSSLIYLFLGGNKIKVINNLDLLFFGLTQLNRFDLSFNEIKQLNIDGLSQYSKKLFQSEKIVFKINPIYDSYFFLFNDNQIEYVKFGFKGLFDSLMELNVQISVDFLYIRFSTIFLKNNKINCSCGLFDDLSFLVNGPLNKSQYFKNFSLTPLFFTECQTKNKKNINLFTDFETLNLKRSEVCEMSNHVNSRFGFKLCFNLIGSFIIYVYFY